MRGMVSSFRFFQAGRFREPKFEGQIGPRIADFPKWYRSTLSGDIDLAKKSPWLSPMAIRCLRKLYLNHCDRLLEYGSGSSTFFALGLVKEVHSVEHSPEWYRVVKDTINLHDRKNWHGTLIEPESDRENRFPEYHSSDDSFKGKSFKSYANHACLFPDDYFDVSLIDGRARPACLLAAAPKTKHVIILDNSERDSYQGALADVSKRSVLHVYGPSLYTKYFSTTSFISVSSDGDEILKSLLA